MTSNQQQYSKYSRPKKDNIQVLISKDKNNYVLVHDRKGIITVISNFKYANNKMEPSLILDGNRLFRTQTMLRTLPAIFIMHTDGVQIFLDTVSKILEFNVPDLSGIVQFDVSKKDKFSHTMTNIFEKVEVSPKYIIIDDENENDTPKYQPTTLKILPVILEKSAMICIVDAVEKVLHCPIIHPESGFIGRTLNSIHIDRLLKFQTIWPDLDLELIVTNGMIYVSSKILIESITEYTNPIYLRIHRNFGGSDLEIRVTHKLMHDYTTNVQLTE